MTRFSLSSHTGECDISVRVWAPDGKMRAVVQIVHGMAEHIERYDAFANFLNTQGILVVGADTASHGESFREGGVRGYFGENDGWTNLVKDINSIQRHIKQAYCTGENEGIPYILFGHSMGSFLARTYASRYGEKMDGFVFCGTAGKNPAVSIGRMLAKNEVKKNGAKTPSASIDKLAFGSYNNKISPNRTKFDWLSTDETEVDKYIASELCGYLFTAAGYRDMFDGLVEVQHKDWANKVAYKPILLIAGDMDPVGAYGKGVLGVAEKLRTAGHDVKDILYRGARHEILNDFCREQVYFDVLAFINGIIGDAA